MTIESEPYRDWRSVEMAIKSAAAIAHLLDPTRLVDDLIRQTYYDRFLCRVFCDGDKSEWVLKGGGSMLARVPNARRTLDADIYREGFDKDQALADLRRIAAVDLGDFFRFVYREHHPILTQDFQPYADGYRVVFDAYLGPRSLQPIKVDLTAHVIPITIVAPTVPANRLELPKLPSFAYRLYPITNQIADKVCASLTILAGKPSSREKDLVDLVVIALTHTIDANQTREAIQNEARIRRLALPERFRLPTTWGRAYAKLARNTPAAGHNIADAQALMTTFIDPLLDGTATGMVWIPGGLAWVASRT